MPYPLHTLETAPKEVRSDLEAAQRTFGFIPNLYLGLAESPGALKVYLSFNKLLQEYGALTPIEQQVVYLTISVENGCTYCVGAHSTLANMAKMPAGILAELREQKSLSDPRLEGLRAFTLSVMEHKGWVPDSELEALYEKGFERKHVIEVITILAQKTLSNYFNHIAATPLDDMFAPLAWESSKAQE